MCRAGPAPWAQPRAQCPGPALGPGPSPGSRPLGLSNEAKNDVNNEVKNDPKIKSEKRCEKRCERKVKNFSVYLSSFTGIKSRKFFTFLSPRFSHRFSLLNSGSCTPLLTSFFHIVFHIVFHWPKTQVLGCAPGCLGIEVLSYISDSTGD